MSSRCYIEASSVWLDSNPQNQNSETAGAQTLVNEEDTRGSRQRKTSYYGKLVLPKYSSSWKLGAARKIAGLLLVRRSAMLQASAYGRGGELHSIFVGRLLNDARISAQSSVVTEDNCIFSCIGNVNYSSARLAIRKSLAATSCERFASQ